MPTHRAVSRKSLVLQKVYWRASEAREVLDLWQEFSSCAQCHLVTDCRIDRLRLQLL